jgi:phosphoribosyl 1,2-cyclic phosphodiesterase
MMRFRVLGSGSDGNATLVEGGGARVLLDAGLGPRQLVERLRAARVDPASLDAIFVSHEHGDHARGALALARRWEVPIAGTQETLRAAGLVGARLPPLQVIEPGDTKRVRRLSVQAVAVPHDATRPLAFVLSAGGVAFGHATDVGHLARGLVLALQVCDTVLVESNHDPALLRDGPYPWRLKERILGPLGHLSNGDVARLVEKGLGVRCRHLVLAHLSRKNNHPDLARLAAEEALARAGRSEVKLSVAEGEGTDWIRVRGARPAGESDDEDDSQLRLF